MRARVAGWLRRRERPAADAPLGVREFRALLRAEQQRSARTDAPFTVLAFPGVEPRRAAAALRARLREGDAIGRLAGGAVAALLRESPASALDELIASLCAELSPDGAPVQCDVYAHPPPIHAGGLAPEIAPGARPAAPADRPQAESGS